MTHPYAALVERALEERLGPRYVAGYALLRGAVPKVCQRCGALVADTTIHDAWHKRQQ